MAGAGFARAFFAAELLAAVFLAADFSAWALVPVPFLAADFSAWALVAVPFLAADFPAGAWVAVPFLAADFVAGTCLAGALPEIRFRAEEPWPDEALAPLLASEAGFVLGVPAAVFVIAAAALAVFRGVLLEPGADMVPVSLRCCIPYPVEGREGSPVFAKGA